MAEKLMCSKCRCRRHKLHLLFNRESRFNLNLNFIAQNQKEINLQIGCCKTVHQLGRWDCLAVLRDGDG